MFVEPAPALIISTSALDIICSKPVLRERAAKLINHKREVYADFDP